MLRGGTGGTGRRRTWSSLRRLIGVAGAFGLMASCAWGTEEEDLDKKALTLRTALHYDPAAEAPLQKLVELYRDSGRLEQLVGLYAGHCAQYPQDAGAKLVLARIYEMSQDRRAAAFFRDAVAAHPQHAELAWRRGRFLLGRGEAQGLEEMARGLGLEHSAGRRALWLGELMKVAAEQGREDLLLRKVGRLLEDKAFSAEQQVRWARQAQRAGLVKTAGRFLEGVNEPALNADSRVEAEMLAAELLAAEGRRQEAGRKLDALLERLAPEYWRRREILMLRLDVAGEGAEREALVAAARARWQEETGKTELHALMLADVLQAAHRGGEALAVLKEAAGKLPDSTALEERLLSVWEAEGIDGDALAWMKDRRAAKPARGDLAARELRWWFMAGKTKEALAAFPALTEGMTAEQQVERSVELARWLRRRNQLGEAAALLDLALKKLPGRWDLRREMAELYVAQGRKDEAGRLFDGAWQEGLAADVRLEAAQFLMVKGLWLEAERFLAPWMEGQAGSFEGLLLMAKIQDRLGREEQVTDSLEKARVVCDTEGRYLAWLETALGIAEARERVEPWLSQEGARVEAEGGEMVVRRGMMLLEQGLNREAKTFVESWLGRLAKLELEAEGRLTLERLRLQLLMGDEGRALEVEQGLKALMEKDVTLQEDHRLALGLFYQKAQRPDLAKRMLEEVKVELCRDVEGMRRAAALFVEMELPAQALACAERLVRLEPGERLNWSRWLGLLGAEGQEERLRMVLREVLGKSAEWRLAPEVSNELTAHVLASYWRSVTALLAGGETEWPGVRRMLTELTAMDVTPEQRRWAEWLTGFVSAKMGDRAAVEAALAKMRGWEEHAWLVFPDGLELSVGQGMEQLRRMVVGSVAKEEAADGRSEMQFQQVVLPPFELRWGFALEPGRKVLRVTVDDKSGVLLVVDDRAWLHAVDARTGKLRWRSPASAKEGVVNAGAAVRMLAGAGMRRNGVPVIAQPLEVAAADGRVCYLSGGSVVCRDAVSGERLWEGLPMVDEEETLPGQDLPEPDRLAIADGRVVVWSPRVPLVTAMSLRSGKRLWQQKALPAAPVQVGSPAMGRMSRQDYYASLRSGLSVDADKVLVYARTAALLRLEDGGVLWRLSGDRSPAFPVELSSSEDRKMAAAWTGGVPAAAKQWVMKTSSGLVSGTGIPGRMGMLQTGRRWSYGNGLNVALDGEGAVSKLLLQGDEVWAAWGQGQVSVHALGLPLGEGSGAGRMVGFAAGRAVFAGENAVQMVRRSGEVTVLAEGTEGGAEQGIGMEVALAGARVHVWDGVRLRVADARRGVVLVDAPVPEGITEWQKKLAAAEPRRKAAVAASPVLRSARFSPGVVLGQVRPRGLPPGTLSSLEWGGEVLTGERSVLAGGGWIFPVSERALAAVETRQGGAP